MASPVVFPEVRGRLSEFLTLWPVSKGVSFHQGVVLQCFALGGTGVAFDWVVGDAVQAAQEEI